MNEQSSDNKTIRAQTNKIMDRMTYIITLLLACMVVNGQQLPFNINNLALSTSSSYKPKPLTDIYNFKESYANYILIETNKVEESNYKDTSWLKAEQYRKNGNEKDSYHWLKLTSQEGNALASRSLYIMEYKKGRNKKALSYFLKSADQGDINALYQLALVYLSKEGAPLSEIQQKNMLTVKYDKKIKAWYKQKIDANSSFPMFMLGMVSENQKGEPSATKEALYWYERTAQSINNQ